MGRLDPSFHLGRAVFFGVVLGALALGAGYWLEQAGRGRGGPQIPVSQTYDLPPLRVGRRPAGLEGPLAPAGGEEDFHLKVSVSGNSGAGQEDVAFGKDLVAKVGNFEVRMREFLSLAQGHQYAKANETLREVAEAAGGWENPSLARVRELLLRQWADHLLQKGDAAQALLVYLDLDALGLADRSYLSMLGLAALGAKDSDRAYRYLRQSWEETGKAEGFSFELADLCYTRNDFECTRKLLEPELEGPRAEKARYVLAKIRQESSVEGSFRGLVGGDEGHFNISFDGSQNAEAAYGTRVILEQARRDVGRDLGYFPADRVGIVLYTRIQYNQALNAPDWSGALYDGKIRLPTGGLGSSALSLRDTIYHEYVHAVIHRMGGERVPAWLHEGLAQMMEPGAAQYRYTGFDAARNPEIPFSVLAGGFSRFNGALASVAYRQSQSFTGYLLAEHGGFRKVKGLLAALQRGLDGPEALLQTYGLSQGTLETRWRGNLERARPR